MHYDKLAPYIINKMKWNTKQDIYVELKYDLNSNSSLELLWLLKKSVT